MRFSSGVFFNHHSPSNESKLDPTPSDKDVAPTHRLGFDEVEERVSLNMASDKLASFFLKSFKGGHHKNSNLLRGLPFIVAPTPTVAGEPLR